MYPPPPWKTLYQSSDISSFSPSLRISFTSPAPVCGSLGGVGLYAQRQPSFPKSCLLTVDACLDPIRRGFKGGLLSRGRTCRAQHRHAEAADSICGRPLLGTQKEHRRRTTWQRAPDLGPSDQQVVRAREQMKPYAKGSSG